MAKQNIVTSPLVIAKNADGSDWYGYEGTPFPDGLQDGELKRLTEAGLVGKVDVEDSDPAAKKSTASK